MFAELVSVLNGYLKSARFRESGGAGLGIIPEELKHYRSFWRDAGSEWILKT